MPKNARVKSTTRRIVRVARNIAIFRAAIELAIQAKDGADWIDEHCSSEMPANCIVNAGSEFWEDLNGDNDNERRVWIHRFVRQKFNLIQFKIREFLKSIWHKSNNEIVRPADILEVKSPSLQVRAQIDDLLPALYDAFAKVKSTSKDVKIVISIETAKNAA